MKFLEKFEKISEKAGRKAAAVHPCFLGGCAGCHSEILAAFSPHYDPARLGITLVSALGQADILLLSGEAGKGRPSPAGRVQESVPGPKMTLAVGACAAKMAAEDLSIHSFVPGCPPRPEAILFALAAALGLRQMKVKGEKKMG